MNGIEKITARITQDAEAEAEKLLNAARAEAEGIRARYEEQAAAQSAKAAESGRAAAAQRLERLEGAAEMEARKLVLEAKQQTIDRAFEKAREKLLALPETDYAELLGRMAAAAAQTGQEEILLSPADRERVGAAVVAKANALLSGGKLSLAADTRELEGGLVLRSGKVEVNCAFETQLRMLRETMAAQVAGVLFP